MHGIGYQKMNITDYTIVNIKGTLYRKIQWNMQKSVDDMYLEDFRALDRMEIEREEVQ